MIFFSLNYFYYLVQVLGLFLMNDSVNFSIFFLPQYYKYFFNPADGFADFFWVNYILMC